jgi:uncharacterized protein YndB with AHSA1/START domain
MGQSPEFLTANTEGDQMAEQTPLHFIFYIAASPNKVWEGFVSPESNRILFSGAELEADLKPGGSISWVGTGADGTRTVYVRGEVLQSEPPRLLQYTFALGSSSKFSRVTIELVPETEATKVSVTHDRWAEAIVATLTLRTAGRASSPASRR